MKISIPFSVRRDLLCKAAVLFCAGVPLAQAEESVDQAPTIRWPPLQVVGGSVLRSVDWTGIAAIVVFWATWCPYCKRHNARINKLFHALDDPSIRILGVAMGDTERQVMSYMKANALDFPVVIGSSELRMQFSSKRVIPLTCLVGSDGRLVQVISGELAEDDVMQLPSQLSRQVK